MITFSQTFCQLPPKSTGTFVTGSNISIFNNPNYSYFSSDTKSNLVKYENIEGSPYIDNSVGANKLLPICKFYSPEFEYMETALARYNAYTDNIEVSLLEDGVNYYLLRKKLNFLYIMLGQKIYRAYEFDNKIGYFVILSKNDKGKCVLLKKERVSFKKEEKAENSFVTSSSNRFEKLKDIFYFKFAEGLVKIPKNKKQFYSLFKNKKDDIKIFTESNRLKIAKNKDLLKISEYYETLFN